MTAQWLERAGFSWLHALEDDRGFAESVLDGVPVRGAAPTGVTQFRLGYCWSHLAHLFPQRAEFARASEKSFRITAGRTFRPNDADFRVYDQSFFLLFMAWYFRLTGERAACGLLKSRYAEIERHLDDAGVGGFGTQLPGLRSHNPYMHLFEALLTAFRVTHDEYWLSEARKMEELFFTRLLDRDSGLVFEFLDADWSVEESRRVEIGHQLEWPTLLLEMHAITGSERLTSAADRMYSFALRHGFEAGGVIDALHEDGRPMDGRRLLWSQTEAVRQFAIRGRSLGDADARERAGTQWDHILNHFIHPNGWSWHNRIAEDGTPVDEPSNARLLYHVVSAAAELT